MPRLWPEWLNDIWAKSAEKGVGGRPESLAQHTWNVLMRLAELARLRPDLPQSLGVPRLWNILFWATFLHDFGKSASGFQSVLRGGPRWPHRHEVLSLAFVDWIASAMTADEQQWLVAAIVSHHKDASEIQLLYSPPDDPDEDQLIARVAEMDEATLQGIWRWLNECPASWVEELGLGDLGVTTPQLPALERAVSMVRQEGVQRIRTWLRTYRRFVKHIAESEDWSLIVGTLTLRGHVINADHMASAHVRRLPTASFNGDAILANCKLPRDKLFKHQSIAEITDGSALLTAPTGSGKTEAALLWAARQASLKSVPRLFYALPYQASMNAMKLRLDESFPGLVGLQHGRSLLVLHRMMLDLDYSPEEASRQAKWMQDLVRLNYPPVRVFSPYQMLKGIYRLKGYEAVLSDYHSAAFIFDEIHAYEVERLALILKTIEFLSRNFGARFLVMSATFPTIVKGWVQQALDNPKEIAASSDLYEAFRRHRLELLDGGLISTQGMDRVANEAKAGKSVLVICNVVSNAQEAYRQICKRLEGTGIPVELLHGRFNVRDRVTKEKLVRESAGSTSDRRLPIVLVATQVVEVSLDIDLDTIYTEPAPLEALVQRFGRVNRRRKQSTLAPVHVYRLPDDGQGIYDRALVARTLAILERENGKPLDESVIGQWLDEVYSGEVADRWSLQYAHAAAEFEVSCVKKLRPFASADSSMEDMFYKAFDSVEVLPSALRTEYQSMKEQAPISAGELLVPIRWRHHNVFATRGLLVHREQDMPPIVRARYDSEFGLMFDESA